jgi:16S rRNA (adenine1518-N6/adenine1519-N6)-dimethyltransferase
MHFKPKKRLGQNFLFDKNVQRKIIQSLELKLSDIVLEIGAGRGELTGLIAERVARICALEIDPTLCEILKNVSSHHSKIEIVNQDILQFNLKKHFRGLKNTIKIVGNIPYYISSPIIEHLLKFKNTIGTIFLTVQKEFAKRMVASPGSKEYACLSCFVQYYTEPKIMFSIKKTCFFPAPKVDSCLVRLKVFSKPKFKPENEKLFFRIIRLAFNKRRKTLRNSLRGTIPKQDLELFLKSHGIDTNARPEDLRLEDFENLTKIVKKRLTKSIF